MKRLPIFSATAQSIASLRESRRRSSCGVQGMLTNHLHGLFCRTRSAAERLAVLAGRDAQMLAKLMPQLASVPKPLVSAICAKLRSVVSRSSLAYSSRSPISQRAEVVPVCFFEMPEKTALAHAGDAAISNTERDCEILSRKSSRSRENRLVLPRGAHGCSMNCA